MLTEKEIEEIIDFEDKASRRLRNLNSKAARSDAAKIIFNRFKEEIDTIRRNLTSIINDTKIEVLQKPLSPIPNKKDIGPYDSSLNWGYKAHYVLQKHINPLSSREVLNEVIKLEPEIKDKLHKNSYKSVAAALNQGVFNKKFEKQRFSNRIKYFLKRSENNLVN